MPAYQFDTQKTKEIDQHLKNMKNVLAEVTVTYGVALELLEKHSEALQVGEVDPFRRQLYQTIRNAKNISASISEQVQRLAETSDGVAHHLDAAGQHAKAQLSHVHTQEASAEEPRRQQVRA